jgi:hypothetical protein
MIGTDTCKSNYHDHDCPLDKKASGVEEYNIERK